MGRYAALDGTIVTNIIDAEANFAASIGAVPAEHAGTTAQIGGGWDGNVFSPPPGPSLADAKAAKSTEILTGSDAAMNAITSTYSANEKLSWPKQEAEAKALLADPNAPAPLLRGIADTRGIALTVLRDNVLANVEASEALTALILGTQQKYEDMVKAATTVEEVQAIEVKYGGI